MKKTSIILLIFICSVFTFTNVSAQKKCKFDTDKKDPFTGKQQKTISSNLVSPGSGKYQFWTLKFVKDSNECKIELGLTFSGSLTTDMKKGDSIMFKFANGNIIILHSINSASPARKVTGTSIPVVSVYTCYFNTLSKEDLNTFSTSLITYVKLNISDLIYKEEIKEKHAKDIQENATCISQ